MVALNERKDASKCVPRIFLSCILNNMPLTGTRLRRIVKICYLNKYNAEKALHVNPWNNCLRQRLCAAKASRSLIRKFEETDNTCARYRFGKAWVFSNCCKSPREDLRSSSCKCKQCSTLPDVSEFYGLQYSVFFSPRVSIPVCLDDAIG